MMVPVLQTASAVPAFNWDFQTQYPHAPVQPGGLSTQQLAAVNQIDATYPTTLVNPNGAGLTTAEMNEVQAIRDFFVLSRDSLTGVVTGRGIVSDGESWGPGQTNPAEKAYFNADFCHRVNRLCDLYGRANTTQAPVLQQLYTDLIEHYLDQNYLPGGLGCAWIGNGYAWRDYGWKTLRMVHTLPANLRDLYCVALAYYSGGQGFFSGSPSASTDTYHTNVETLNRSLALMTDTPAKWQLMGIYRRGLDLSIIGDPASGAGSLVPLDGSIIHHGGHHQSYASYSYMGMLLTHERWTRAGFTTTYTPQTIERLRKGALAWAFTSTGGTVPAHQSMRSFLSEKGSVIDNGAGSAGPWLIQAASLTNAYDGTPIANDLEMAYAAIAKLGAGSTALPVEWRSMSLPSNPDRSSKAYTAALKGFFSHTTNGTSVLRGPGQWYASVRSNNPAYRGGEGYDGMGLPDHFNTKSMHSALMLITTGKNGYKPNEMDSGFVRDGWDYFYYPNVTCADGNPGDLLYWRTPAYMGGGADLMGSADLRESGLWMSQWGVRKSGFFLGNRIVMATSDVSGSGLHTGLIQYAHTTPASEPVTVDGASRTQDGDWILSPGGNHKLVDPQGNGYFVHAGASTPQMRVRRGLQKWTYALAQNYIGSGAAPSFVYASDFLARMSEFNPTTATYTKVWFDHGAAAANQGLEYSVLVKPQAGDLDAYVTAMSNPATAPVVVEKNSNMHRYWDRATGTHAAAVFNSTEPINREGILTVNRPGAYLWRRDADLLRLSVSSSDVSSSPPFSITLSGTYTLEASEDTHSVSVTSSGGNTVVSLSVRQAAPQRVVLRSQGDTQWKELTSTVDVGSAHAAFSVNLNSAGIGTSPTYAIVSGNPGGLFAISGNQLTATRAFVPGDAGTQMPLVRVTQGSTVLGTVLVTVTLTDNLMAAQLADTDGDGFRDVYETSSGTNPNNASSKPTTALAAFWDFNQTQTPYDCVGGISGAFLNGATFSADAAGHGGGSGNRSLDLGSTGTASMSASGLANLNRATAGGKLTISFWQKLDTVANNFAFYALSPSSPSQRGISAHVPHGTTVYFDAGGANAAQRASVVQPVGMNWTQWAHIALVRDGGTAQIWVNGILLKTETGKVALKSDLTQLLIGSGINGETGLLGEIDDFAVFAAALNSTQIGSLAGGASPLAINVPAAPVNLPPAITSTSFTVTENIAGGAVVGTMVGSDPESSAITWAIDGTALADVFGINSSTGALTLKAGAVLDHETRTSYDLNVIARDAAGASTLKIIQVNVTDVNEAPVAKGLDTTLLDSVPVGSTVGTVTSTDADTGQSRTWSITAGNTGGTFAVNPTTGVITVAQALDGTTTPTYNLTLRVTDSGGLYDDVLVLVSVYGLSGITADADGDGFSDAFERMSGSNPASSSSVPVTLLAAYWSFDQTGSPATFSDSIRALPAQPFVNAAMSATGTGRSGGANDRALDLGAMSGASRVEVSNVAWLNQLAAANKITISYWQKLSSVENNHPFYAVSPSSAANRRGIAAHTPHGGNFYFDYGGAAAPNRINVAQPAGFDWMQWVHVALVRNGSTAEIWANGVLLKSETGEAALKTDFNKLLIGAGLDASFNATMSLTGKIDDFAIFSAALIPSQIATLASGASPFTLNAALSNVAPVITTNTFDIAEGTQGISTVGTVLASDPDGPDIITWSMTGGGTLFSIDPVTGVISSTAEAVFDHEATDSYTVTVTAKDAYEAGSSKAIVIHVTDLNEAPVFIANPINKAAGVTGSAYSGTLEGSATDVDGGETLTYAKVSGPTWLNVSPGGTLSGTPGSGNVETNVFTVSITDAGGLSATATLNIPVSAALPAGWTSQDIGPVGLAGVFSHSGGTYSVTAAGTGFDGTSDSFGFAWQTMSGDGEIKARMTGMTGATAPFSCVMIRETTAAGARLVTSGRQTDGGMWAHWRTSTGGSIGATGNGTLALPAWVRLVRTGNTFDSYHSTDGVNWTLVSTKSVTMASQVLVGLAVTSRSTTTSHTATFDNVTVVP